MGKPDVIDPVAAALASPSTPPKTTTYQLEPVHSWVVALAEAKAELGGQLSWATVRQSVIEAAKAVVASAEAGERTIRGKVSGVERPLTQEEIEHCHRYVKATPTKRSIQNYVERHHPELWERLCMAANGGVTRTKASGE